MNEVREKRKVRKGVVLSNKMNKTVVVQVAKTLCHPKYGKVLRRSVKYYAHNELEGIKEGDSVVIMETRPLSKLKCWRVVERCPAEG